MGKTRLSSRKWAAELKRTTGFEPATLTLAKKKPHGAFPWVPHTALTSVSSSAVPIDSAELPPFRRFTLTAINVDEPIDRAR
jgi:hypothetical protein